MKMGDDTARCEAVILAALPEESRRRKPIATVALISISALMAALVFGKYGSFEPDLAAFLHLGANIDSLTFGGQVWRLLSSSFLHFGLPHLLLNVICLFSFGSFLEKMIGGVRLLCVYLLTAALGGVFSCVMHEDTVCAGASGAVFGLFGATMAYIALSYRRLGIRIGDLMGYLKNSLIFVGINFVYSLMPDVDMAAHVGGLVGGLAVGALLAAPIRMEKSRYAEKLPKIVEMASALLFVVVVASWFVAHDTWRLSAEEVAGVLREFLVDDIAGQMKSDEADKVNVEIVDIELVHDGGDEYHGRFEARIECNGEVSIHGSDIKVTCDGQRLTYESVSQ